MLKMEIRDTSGYKEFKQAFNKLKAGFIGMSSNQNVNNKVRIQLSTIESEIDYFAEIIYDEE
jgi:hypothetical protein